VQLGQSLYFKCQSLMKIHSPPWPHHLNFNNLQVIILSSPTNIPIEQECDFGCQDYIPQKHYNKKKHIGNYDYVLFCDLWFPTFLSWEFQQLWGKWWWGVVLECASKWENDDEFCMRVGEAIKESDCDELCVSLESAGWFDSPTQN